MRIATSHKIYSPLRLPILTVLCFFFAFLPTHGIAQTTTTTTTCNVTANAGPDIILCPGNSVTLNGTATATSTTTTTTVAAAASSVYSTAVPATHGWTFSDTRWSRVTTNLAGGAAAGEFRFTYGTSATSSYSVTSPLIAGAGFSGMTMSFRHFLDNYNPTTYPYTLSVQTSPDGVTWTTRWSVTPTTNADIAASTVSGINLSALSGTNFYVRFNFNGATFGLDYWYLDDITINGFATTSSSTSTSLTPTYTWTPVATISGGANTLSPTVAPAASTNYILSVTASSCLAKDTALVSILNLSANAGPDFGICNGTSIVIPGTATASPSTIVSAPATQVYNTAVPVAHGWTFSDPRWSRVATNSAGGAAGEFRFYYSASATGSYTATSPAINATSFSAMNLSFKHYVNNFSGSTNPYTLSVQTSTDGITWTTRWNISPTATIAATTVSGIDLSALSGTTFYLRLTFSGQETGINGWYVDDLTINGNSTVFVNPVYSWTPATSITSGATTLTPTIAPAVTTNYVLTSSAFGCTAKDTVKVSVLSVNAGPDISACFGNSVSLNGTSTTPAILVPTTTTTTFAVSGQLYNTPVPTTHGWTFSDTRWSQVATNLAGGAAGEFRFYYSASTNASYTATSPAVNGTAYSGLTLSFRQYLNNYNGTSYPYTVSVQTSTDGVTWTTRWSTSPTASIPATTVSGIDLSALNGTTFYLRLNFTGQEFGIFGWYVDDIIVSGTTNVTTTATTNTTVPVTYAWSPNATITSGATSLAAVAAPVSTTTYLLTATAGSCSANDDIVVNLPTPSGLLAASSESATCIVKAGETVRFYNTTTGNYITTITAGPTNLGSTTATAYVDAAVDFVPACLDASLETAVLQRHWVITPSIQGSAVVRLPYSATELTNLIAASVMSTNPNDEVIDQSTLKLSKYSGDYTPFDAVMTSINVDADPDNNCTASGGTGLTELISQTVSGSSPVAAVTALYSDFSIASFSEFWLHGSDNASPLPVELSSFTVNCSGADQLVEWETESEFQCDHFDLEETRDGVHWEVVASVQGNGTTQAKHHYASEQALTGESVYFRLKEVDQDGSNKTYGPIASNCATAGNQLVAFPNPASGAFTVLISSTKKHENAQVILSETNGKLLKYKTLDIPEGATHLNFEELQLAPGTYLIAVVCDSNAYKPIKLIIQ